MRPEPWRDPLHQVHVAIAQVDTLSTAEPHGVRLNRHSRLLQMPDSFLHRVDRHHERELLRATSVVRERS